MNLRKYTIYLLTISLLSCSSNPTDPNSSTNTGSSANGPEIKTWTTTIDKSQLLNSSSLTFKEKQQTSIVISIDTTAVNQTMDGFGYALTGGSAYLINQKMNASDRSSLLQELFLSDGNGIGISYLRISIGASDLDAQVFSYDDLPVGETDETLSKFNLDPDRANLIPILKEIKNLNPQIKIMGSPWSAPVWMKTNGAAKGGSLDSKYYSAYAQYFVKYIQEMAKEGITIDAVTLQNEPENPGNTPSMTMTASEQATFVKTYLGPAFQAASITTKIVVFDHNCDHPDYPIAILNDAQAKPFVDGSAFHLYLGDINALSTVHNSHPDKNIYFTEQWTSGTGNFGGDLRWHVKNLIVGAPRNWSRNVLEWNLAADENFNPHTSDGGCTSCQGAITINSVSGVVKRNVSYYIIAHASKFVPAGSVRISSNIADNLYNVAFLTPTGKKVLIVLNDNNIDKTFSIQYKNFYALSTLAAGAVCTYVW